MNQEKEILRDSHLRSQLLNWYMANRRDLPWRQTNDPYAIWVSEVMLQQTRVAAVIDRFNAFMERFPTLLSLAMAAEQDVLASWSGLGYYRRARMLHKAAGFVAENLNGVMPVKAEELRNLPGIGFYTAAAIASIAHGEQIAVVDGNVERVVCRLSGWQGITKGIGSSATRKKIQSRADELVDPQQPGEFNQAMMELGATICLPKSPVCAQCPIVDFCATRGEHETTPRAKMVSEEVGYALVIRAGKQTGRYRREVLLEQRSADQTVMPGMWELPQLIDPIVPDDQLRMTARHAIMQVNYYVRVRDVAEDEVDTKTVTAGERSWIQLGEAVGMALTGLTRKILSRTHLLPTVHPVAQGTRRALPLGIVDDSLID